MRERLIKYGLPVFFFLLPWQTRWIFGQELIAGEPFEYGILSLYATEILLLIIMFSFGRLQFKPEYRPVAWLGLLILVPALLSTGLALNSTLALEKIMHLAFALILFLLLLDRRVRLRSVLLGFGLGLVGPVLLGVWQVAFGSSGASSWLGLAARDAHALGEAVTGLGGGRTLRAYGSLSHPNIFGGYLAIGLIAVYYLRSTWSSIRARHALSLVLLWLALGLLLTLSQSAWLGLALAALVGLSLTKIKKIKLAKGVIVALAITTITGATIYLFMSASQIKGDYEARSSSERVEMYHEWPATIAGSTDLLAGHGIGNYTLALAATYSGREWWQYQPIHNVPLLIISELGLFGLIVIGLWASTIDRLNFARFPHRDAIVACAMGNVLLVIMFVDHYLWSSWAGLALVALVMALTVRFGEDE